MCTVLRLYSLHHPQLRLKDAALAAFQRVSAYHEAYKKSLPPQELKAGVFLKTKSLNVMFCRSSYCILQELYERIMAVFGGPADQRDVRTRRCCWRVTRVSRHVAL